METLLEAIKTLGKTHQAEKIILFGSRARGDHHDRSDIDLAIYGMPQDYQANFWSDVDDLPTLLKFDLVHIVPYLDEAFLQNIEKDGVIIYERL